MLLYNLDRFSNTEVINLEGGENEVDLCKASQSKVTTSTAKIKKHTKS
jgi:hypothetical protein